MDAFRAQDVAQMTATPAVSCDTAVIDVPKPPMAAAEITAVAIPNEAIHTPAFLSDLLKVPIA